jgi:hypothetical protein
LVWRLRPHDSLSDLSYDFGHASGSILGRGSLRLLARLFPLQLAVIAGLAIVASLVPVAASPFFSSAAAEAVADDIAVRVRVEVHEVVRGLLKLARRRLAEGYDLDLASLHLEVFDERYEIAVA